MRPFFVWGCFPLAFEVFTPLSNGRGAEDDGRVWKTGGLAVEERRSEAGPMTEEAYVCYEKASVL